MMEEDKVITEKEFDRNPLLDKQVESTEEDNEFKNFVINFTGQEHQPENGDVTVEMIMETLANNFPEVVMVLAEENFIRGYSQALDDKRAFNEQG
jgi:uncharacterized protein with von Willebrand factor type A (vWA) domain